MLDKIRSYFAVTLLITFSLLSWSSYAAEAGVKPLSLSECIDIALKNHPSIRVSEGDISVAKEQYRGAYSAYYPRLELNSSFSRSDNNSLIDPTTDEPIGETDAYSAFLKAEQNIYDFGRRTGRVEAVDFRVDSRNAVLERTRQNIVYGVKEAYFNVLKGLGLVRVQEAATEQAEAHLRQATAFFEVGTKARFDVTTAEVELNQAKLGLIQARNRLNISIALLKNRMGMDYSYPLEIESVQDGSKTVASLEEGLSEALKSRQDIRSLDSGIKESEAILKTSRGGYYPFISAAGSYGYYTQAPAGEGDFLFKEDNRRWNVTLSLNIPIFEGYITDAAVSEASARIDVLKAQKDTLLNDIMLDVSSSYLQLQDAGARISVAESGLSKAKENLDIANGRYKVGVGTLIEVTDAQSGHTKAETDVIDARYDLEIAKARFEKAVGKE